MYYGHQAKDPCVVGNAATCLAGALELVPTLYIQASKKYNVLAIPFF